ncbi:MAG: DUF2905 domain-containing protein [Deltaproteobacteria bacterium]|nr:DUF2905 domain-containing protein [Deltaproteobacteria bacterium]
MSKPLLLIGILCILASLGWPLIRRVGLGWLPGDIHIKGSGYEFHFPFVTCLLVSLLLSVLAWLWRNFFG